MQQNTPKKRSHLKDYSLGLALMAVLGVLGLVLIGVVIVGIGFLLVTMPMSSAAVIGVLIIAAVAALVKKYKG